VRADGQMTTSFFLLRPATGSETIHSQMTTSIWVFWCVSYSFKLIPAIYHKRVSTVRADGQMTTSFFMLRPENPRQRNKEACTGGKLQDGWWMAEKRRISNIQRYAISLSNCPKLSDNTRVSRVY